MHGVLNRVNILNHSQEPSIFICAVVLTAKADIEVMLSQADIPGADLCEPFDRHTLLLEKCLEQARLFVVKSSSRIANSHKQAAFLSGFVQSLGKQ